MMIKPSIYDFRDELIEKYKTEEANFLFAVNERLNNSTLNDFSTLYETLYEASKKDLTASSVQCDFFIRKTLERKSKNTPQDVLKTLFGSYERFNAWDFISCNDSICFANIGDIKDGFTKSNYHLINLDTLINVLGANNIELQMSKPDEAGTIKVTAKVNLNTIDKARKERKIREYVLTGACPADALREYVDSCVKNQRKFMNPTNIPEEYLIPKNIVFSDECIRYFFEGDICDFVGASEGGKSISFYWKRSEKYPALEVRVILNSITGEYELEYLKENISRNKNEFVWERSSHSGKTGTIMIYKPTDPLDEIVDMGRCKKIG